MRILLSNDDGVYAPGIKNLYKALKKLPDTEVYMVAPLEERSATGHTMTFDSPLRIVEVEENVFGCSGYPADCALMGMAYLLKDNPPDLVISGINRGANLGQDVYYSGTVAAAREAAFRQIPAIAVSLVVDFLKTPPKGQDDEMYLSAASLIFDLVSARFHELITPGEVLNINVPNLERPQLKGLEMTCLGRRHYSQDILERQDFRGRNYFWIGGIYKGFESIPGSDCLVVDEQKVSITLLNHRYCEEGQSLDREKVYREFINSFNSHKFFGRNYEEL